MNGWDGMLDLGLRGASLGSHGNDGLSNYSLPERTDEKPLELTPIAVSNAVECNRRVSKPAAWMMLVHVYGYVVMHGDAC